MPRIYIETYGCRWNGSPTPGADVGVLGREGYGAPDDPAQADVVLVNTCAVRDHASKKVLSRMGELKRLKRPAVCWEWWAAWRSGSAPVARAGAAGRPVVARRLSRAARADRAGACRGATSEVVFKRWEHYEDVPPVRGDAVSAFVTVQRGCDYRCTFCIVPIDAGAGAEPQVGGRSARGDGTSRARTTEVTLLGQTVNSYNDGVHDFADLLRAVGAVAGVRRLRFTSPIPRISPTAWSPPWRRRPRCASTCTSRCRAARRASSGGCCGATIGTAISRWSRRCAAPSPVWPSRPTSSSGSRAETEDDFQETLSLVERVGFDDAYTFKYSPREGDARDPLKDAVPDPVAGERLERLVAVVRGIARRRNVALVGSTYEVAGRGARQAG